MFYAKRIMGSRIIGLSNAGVKFDSENEINNFGAHIDFYPCPYFTVAAAIGMTEIEVDLLI